MSDVERITEQNQERIKWAKEEQRKYDMHMKFKEKVEIRGKKIKKFEKLASFCCLLSFYLVGVSTGISAWLLAKSFMSLSAAAMMILAFSAVSMLLAFRFSDIANER